MFQSEIFTTNIETTYENHNIFSYYYAHFFPTT